MKKPNQYSEAETFHNATMYISHEVAEVVEKGLEKFVEIVGSSDPDEWKKEGYHLYTNERTRTENVLQETDYILVRGKKVVAGFKVLAQISKDHKINVNLSNLTLDQAQQSLGLNKN